MMLREVKPRNARSARILKAREPQLIENATHTLILHGGKCPQPIQTVLKTFASLTKPNSVLLNKKNENIHPFENVESLEFLAKKNDCSLVAFGSHSKKRPNALTLVRMFDYKVLEMVEMLLLPTADGAEGEKLQVGVGMKPMMLFAGSVWDDPSASTQGQTYTMLKGLFLDMFSGEETKKIDVEGLQYLVMIAAGEPEPEQAPVIHLRWYKIRTQKSGQKLPRVEVDEVGPKVDFKVGRVREAEPAVMKEAMKQGKRPDDEFRSKKKNVGMDAIGDKIGKVHLGRQDLGGLQTRKMKGLKRKAGLDIEDEEDLDVDGMMDVDDIDSEETKRQRLF